MSSFKYDLSIALIVKNEEKVLRRCLDSLAPLREALSCQIIITDTGSTDGTIEIAKEYADTFIEFEWINDFSAARNTGVKAAEGRWFLYIDADEYFDESVLEVVKFLKSSNANKYGNASITRRDYSKGENSYYDVVLFRLVNFTNSKLYFQEPIHEFLEVRLERNYNINALLHHDGYVGEKFAQKTERNQPVIEKILEDDPTNIRAYMHIIISMDNFDKRLVLCEKALKIFEENNLPETIYTNALFAQCCNLYCYLKQYEKSVEIGEKYLKNHSDNIIPVLEIYFLLGDAYYSLKQYDKSVLYFKKYQKLYEILQKKPDIAHATLSHSIFLAPLKYQASYINRAMALIKLGNIDDAKSMLKKVNLSDFVDDNIFPNFVLEYLKVFISAEFFNEVKALYLQFKGNAKIRSALIHCIEQLLFSAMGDIDRNALIQLLSDNTDSYLAINLLRSCNFNINDCGKDIMDVIVNDTSILDLACFSDVVYSCVKSGKNIFDYLPNSSSEKLYNFLISVEAKHLNWFETVYDYLLKIDFDSKTPLKTILFSRDLAYTALLIINKNNHVYEMDKKVNFLFELFLTLSNHYISSVYNKDITPDILRLIPSKDSFAYAAHQGYIVKESEPAKYLTSLKEALTYNNSLSVAVKIVMKNISQEVEKRKSQSTEFAQLAVQVKAQISQFISIGKLNEAKMLVEQYAKINPSDPELPSLYEKLK